MCNKNIGSFYQQQSKQQGQFPILKIGIIGASMVFGLVNMEIGK
jgi:hypothetical protein